jgi:hypothetical protein
MENQKLNKEEEDWLSQFHLSPSTIRGTIDKDSPRPCWQLHLSLQDFINGNLTKILTLYSLMAPRNIILGWRVWGGYSKPQRKS